MSANSSNTDSTELGQYLWRGGQKIELEKEKDRFTMITSNPDKIELIKNQKGIRNVKHINNQIYKVETTSTERDAAMSLLRSEAFNLVAHHAYRPKNTEGSIFYITDKIIVKFKSNAEIDLINELLTKYSLKVVKEYEHTPHTYLLQVTSTSGKNPIKIANQLAEEDLIIYAEPNLVNRFKPSFIPSDPYFQKQWHLNAQNGPQLLAESSVNAPAAWDITKGNRDIVVAIIDDGFDLNHPDFQGENKIVFPKDYIDGDSKPFPEREKGDYHGTPCAGVAIAENNNTGTVGVAPDCAFMPVRFPLSAEDDQLIVIFHEVGQRANIISCSWGPVPVNAPISRGLSEKFTELANSGGNNNKGCVICFAAGNNNAPLNDPENHNGFLWKSDENIRKTTGPILNGLATHPDVVAVAASTSLNKHAVYSNWGAEISVCAPSNNFHPINSQQFVPGRGIVTTDNEEFGFGFTRNSIYTNSFGGTSSATPLVAGVAALILSANSNLRASEVKEILQSTADKIVDTDIDPILGSNHGQYDENNHCAWFGFGKVNAEQAVKEALNRIDQ